MPGEVCFYAHGWHHLQNLEPVIRELERRGTGCRAILFAPRDDNYPRVELLLPREKLEILSESRTFRLAEKLNALGKPGRLLGFLWSFLWLVAFFERRRPARVAVTEDITLWSNLTTRAARVWRIPCVLLPLESIHFAEVRMGQRLRMGHIVPERPTWLQRLANRLYPINVQPYAGKLLHWYSPYRILASYPLGLLPDSPWIRGSSATIDRVAVNSQVQLEENVRYGLDAHRQFVTGFPMHDRLVDCVRQRDVIRGRMLAQLGVQDDRKICLIVGTTPPVLWTKDELPAAYRAHGDLICALHESLGDRYAILFKVHPWENRVEFIHKIGGGEPAKFLKNEFSVYELLAASDLIVMFKSSTVIASLALEVPVLAYGMFGLPGMPEFYNRYMSAEQVYSLDDIREVLKRVDDPSYREDLRCRRQADRAKFGLFDGSNTQRIVELILR